jgi:hypothetical protein
MILFNRFVAATGAAVSLLLSGGSAPAYAGLVKDVIDFTATSFLSVPNSGDVAPINPVTGEITVILDPTVENGTHLKPVSTGITLNNINIKVDNFPIVYHNQLNGLIEINGLQTVAGQPQPFQVSSDTDNFLLEVSLKGSGVEFFYSQDLADNFLSFDVTAKVTSTPVADVAVAEPSSIAVIGVGFAGLAMIRRRRTVTAWQC